MNTSDTFYSPNFNWNGDFDRLQDDYELFYDEEGQVTQFRLNLKDDDADIRNKKTAGHFRKEFKNIDEAVEFLKQKGIELLEIK